MPDVAEPPNAKPSPRRNWLLLALVVVAIPAALCAAAVVSLGLRTRAAAASVRRFCDAHPVGSRMDAEEVVARARSLGRDYVSLSLPGGAIRVEARDGAMTTVYRCTLDVLDGRVTSRAFARED